MQIKNIDAQEHRTKGINEHWDRVYADRGFNRELLYSLYWDEQKSINQIARQLNTSSNIIFKLLKRFEIPRRGKHEHNILRFISYPDLRSRIGDSHRGSKHSIEANLAKSKRQMGRQPSIETRAKLSQSIKLYYANHPRKPMSLDMKQKLSEINILRFIDHPEALKKLLPKSPTKPEIKLSALLESQFPGKFKFNGDFSLGVSLNGLVPDFVNVNGKKQVIELFGTYWHSEKRLKANDWKRTELGRIMAFNSLGWDCLIIWESEMKNEAVVLNKINKFVNRRHKAQEIEIVHGRSGLVLTDDIVKRNTQAWKENEYQPTSLKESPVPADVREAIKHPIEVK